MNLAQQQDFVQKLPFVVQNSHNTVLDIVYSLMQRVYVHVLVWTAGELREPSANFAATVLWETQADRGSPVVAAMQSAVAGLG